MICQSIKTKKTVPNTATTLNLIGSSVCEYARLHAGSQLKGLTQVCTQREKIQFEPMLVSLSESV